MLLQLVDGQVIVEDSIAKGTLLDVLHVLTEQEVRHLTVTTRQRTPAFDQNISLWQCAAQRDG